jgi:2-polyprenyl-3-methyl-5-hydroxy-6-metoxy-1,4-benzoquinol methylase
MATQNMTRDAEPDQDYRARIYQRYASNFQDSGETFDAAAATRWGAAYGHYFRGWLPKREARIVDLACGGGRLLHFYRERGYARLTGVDISPDQVALSRQVIDDVVQGEILDFLATRPAAYDLITGLDIIEHFRKPEVLRFLDGCHHALKPGGRVILQTPNADSPWGTVHRYNDFTHEVGFNPNSLSRLMTLCGFEHIECRETGPVPVGHGMASLIRALTWQAIRLLLIVWNLAEIGHRGSGVFTRVFLISGTRADAE